MRTEEFREWLESSGMKKRSQSDAISRCSRVECSVHVDLDDEYKKDGGKSLIALLEYTADDARSNRPAPDGVEIDGDIRSGLASLKSAAKTYFKFSSTV